MRKSRRRNSNARGTLEALGWFGTGMVAMCLGVVVWLAEGQGWIALTGSVLGALHWTRGWMAIRE